jgi:hypothetical protein
VLRGRIVSGHKEVPCDPFTKDDAGGTPAA